MLPVRVPERGAWQGPAVTPHPGPVDAGPSSSTRPGRPGGLVLQPFRALRYAVPDSDLSLVTSPPYDVVDDVGAAVLEELSPSNVVRLILPRDTPDVQDRPAAAAALLAAWRRDGVLRQDPEPALYVYEQAEPDGGHVQRGLLGALALTPSEDGVVLPHEDTMAGVVAERLALYSAVRADLEPILLVHDGGLSAQADPKPVDRPSSGDGAGEPPRPASGRGATSELVSGVDREPALVDAVLPDGRRHRLWAVTDPGVLAAVAADLLPRRAVIADGHHRYATYLRRQADRHAAGDGPGPWDLGLALLVDAQEHGPCVHAVHRVVRGVPAAELAERSASGRPGPRPRRDRPAGCPRGAGRGGAPRAGLPAAQRRRPHRPSRDRPGAGADRTPCCRRARRPRGATWPSSSCTATSSPTSGASSTPPTRSRRRPTWTRRSPRPPVPAARPSCSAPCRSAP